jgi:transcriptional regulator with XRE-family HTH domain/tetratricopeptide (TPR) repeat protein
MGQTSKRSSAVFGGLFTPFVRSRLMGWRARHLFHVGRIHMVKKAAQATPNQLLRRARLERGWTQKVVADRIGAPNDVMVTRWERGTAFPSTYYVERLCQLFGQRASELGLLRDPDPQTASQHLPNRQSWPDLPEEQAREHVSMMSTVQHDSPVARLSHLPLIGREAEARALREIYRVVQQGQTQAVIIQGEAGIGKTSLASTFLGWAATEGATLLQGRAFEMGGRLPYQPLVHALSRRLEQEQAPEALLSAAWLTELSRMLPELRDRYPHLPPIMGDETAARIRLFEAMTRLGQAFCERAPVVLFIDDIQWADAASLDVLHYAGQRWSESGIPLLLLLSTRSEALAMTTPLNKWLAGLHHALPVTDLVLGSLTQEETLKVLDAIGTGHTAARHSDRFTEIGQWLFRETHGQPFYLVETLKVLLERQILTVRSSSHGEELKMDMVSLSAAQQRGVLPPGVRRLILSHLEQLTTTGRVLVMGSATLGRGASFDLLCRVADLEERDALVALDEVLRQGLLREVTEEDGRGQRSSVGSYIFGHDKMREVIYTEMGEAQRRLLHRRALSVCEAHGRPAAELAHHAVAAGLTEQAFGFSLMAGEEAVRLLARAEATLHYIQALEVLSQLPDSTDTRRRRVDTILKLVEVSLLAVSLERTLERLVEAEDLARVLPDPDRKRLAYVHYWIGHVHCARNAMRQAIEYAQHVQVEARELGDEALVALASVQLSRAWINQGHYGLIEGLLTPIIPVLERTGYWLDWTYALGFVGVALAARGQVALGVAQGQHALELARSAGEMKSRGVTASHFLLSVIYLFGGDPLRVLSESCQVVEGAELLDEWLLVYLGYGFRGWAESRLGKHEEALQSMAHSQAASQRLGGHVMLQDVFAAAIAELLLAAGRVEEALARAEAAVELGIAVGGTWSEGIAQRVWGQALACLSRWEEAETHLAKSWQTLLSGEIFLEVAHTQVAWGLLCRDYGDLASAQEHFKHAATQFEASGLTRERKTVESYLAQIVQSRS